MKIPRTIATTTTATQVVDAVCRDCAFFVPGEIATAGTCHAGPPLTGGWPAVAAHEGCGEFEPRPAPR